MMAKVPPTAGVSGRWGAETRHRNEKTQNDENAQKTRRVPTCPLRALLGDICPRGLRLTKKTGGQLCFFHSAIYQLHAIC